MLKKRAGAWAVLAAVLVLGTVFGSFRSLSGLRKDTAEAFYVGADGSGYGIASDLDLRVEYARNLCKIAADYDVAAEINAVEEACTALEDAENFGGKYDANNALTGAVDTLSLALQKQPLTQEDEGYRKSLTADIASYEMKIDKEASSFNAEVREFNEEILGGVPARFFGALTGVDEVEEYQ